MSRGKRMLRTAIALWALVLVILAISLAGPAVFNGLTILNLMALALAFVTTAKALRRLDVERDNQKRHNQP